MRRSYAALSPKFKMNTHPKNAVRWRPGTPGFWKPKYGASYFKWNYKIPYVREAESLHHYPETSRITGKVIDWYHDEPQDGYEGLRIFGEHTLELTGMPLGRTPEYMQERLRRFFSKFGPVKHCRAEPHPADPYQCEGKAWVSFRDRTAALKALRAPLKFPASLHDKIVSMRHLDSDKRNDPNYFEKAKFWNDQIISVARQLHVQLSSDEAFRASGKPLRTVGSGLWERELVEVPQAPVEGRAGVAASKGLHGAPTRLVRAEAVAKLRFGSWERLLAEPPFDELFVLEQVKADSSASTADDGAGGAGSDGGVAEAKKVPVVVRPRLVSTTQRARILARARHVLARQLHDEFSVWWREGRVKLPDYTQRRMDWWDHKPRLPFELQVLSRSKDRHRLFDEKWIYKQQLCRERNSRRKEKRQSLMEEKKKVVGERMKARNERRDKTLAAIGSSGGLLGHRSQGLVPPSGGGVGGQRSLAR